ncbi:helix-turn-helix transcriptional regulator [Micromonospora sp. CPCC 206061]|uniref:helix-turn-helix transcriptional regulator n=1 Tax=Micromonospora sp. CPCC 206061 TaxID=3122410 RepID=UPI002FF10C9D
MHAAGLDVFEGRCGLDRTGFTPPSYESVHRLTLIRSGAFLVRVNGQESFVDCGAAVFTHPGDELRLAHPLGCGDTFTTVEFASQVLAGREGEWGLSVHRLPLDDDLDLLHRTLVAASRRGVDAFAVVDQMHGLLDRLLTAPGSRAVGVYGAWTPRRRETLVAHRRLADRAREALAAGQYTVGLDELAALVSTSPHHLSRVFRQVTGETLTAYRNRLRVRAVLSDLQDGAGNLRTLAARHGFADQAHLTRVVRRQLGHLPSEVRRMLAAPG